jgi:hypothetical protein
VRHASSTPDPGRPPNALEANSVNQRKLTDKRGNLLDKPDYDDTRRLTKLIGRLENLTISLPEARKDIDTRIRETVDAQGQGGGSGISDTVARAGLAIATEQNHHRALNQALRTAEDAIDHLSVEARRAQGRLTPVEPETPLRCPAMVLLQQTVHANAGDIPDEVLVRCDHLTAHRVDDRGNPIDYDRDGYCETHRAEANEAMRRAQIEQGRRLRRRGAA